MDSLKDKKIEEIAKQYEFLLPGKAPDPEYEYQKYSSTKTQLKELYDLVRSKAGETELHNYLANNKNIFAFALHFFFTGHHGIYVFSKQQIIPKIQGVSPGLIPDFIVGGQNSDGIQWWIVELKGANENIFTEDASGGIKFSLTANSAVFQLLEYMHTATEIQAQLRDKFKMTNFSSPNGLILMGTEDELNSHERKQRMKKAWNDLHPKKLEIRTYHWLLRNFVINDKEFDFPET